MRRYHSVAERFFGVRLIVVLAIALCVAGCTPGLAKRFQSHIDYLASDELTGRAIGTRGIELASDYIADQFSEMGLRPAGDDGTFFQTFPMTLHRTLHSSGRLAFTRVTDPLRLEKDFIPFRFSSDDPFEGDLFFCGYGIVAPDRDRDDYVHADVKGKVALMLRGEPPSWTDENDRATRHGMLRNKVYNAKDREVVAVLIVNQAPQEGKEDELMQFEGRGAEAYGVPAFHITRELAEKILAAGGLDSLATLQERLDAGGYASARLANVRASGQAVFETKSAPTRNVLGWIRGEGPLADEFIVIGAHYDHLGIRKPRMRTFKEGKLVKETRQPEIHNGADDNASGTSGVIEIARMFAAGPPPRRSVLFAAFTAEETGLHGSLHYVKHPFTSLDNTVAMLNMDMIGRMEPGQSSLQVFGVGCGEGFAEVLERTAAPLGLSIAATQDAGGRSDQGPFVAREIPSLHFFTGHHGDYHKPTDDSDKINARAGAKVVTLVYETARELAKLESRPTFKVVKSSEPEESGGNPAYRVVMGLAPGYGDDGKPGMAAEAVSPDGPADLAGMKGGDRVIRIGGKKIDSIYDYMGALRNSEPGDTVEVVVLRDGKELILKVTLAPAG